MKYAMIQARSFDSIVFGFFFHFEEIIRKCFSFKSTIISGKNSEGTSQNQYISILCDSENWYSTVNQWYFSLKCIQTYLLEVFCVQRPMVSTFYFVMEWTIWANIVHQTMSLVISCCGHCLEVGLPEAS